jgi:sigma-B regulation protein RsbU (phosphoserine phosphatase)
MIGQDALVSNEWAGSDAGRLADLQTLTDTKLTSLDLDNLLDELLARVREIIAVDTAAVLLFERGAEGLVARASCGIEDEVRQGVRVPVGIGFAGRIAATRQTVRLDRVDSTTVSNPILWEKGIKTMLGVPLLRGNELLGVLHVGRLDGRPFSDRDEVLLQVVGDRIAGAIQTRQLADERAATGLLERSLLPAKLPICPGLAFATRYVGAEHKTIGGDWYDIFTVPSGQLWIVMGDVAGHGLQAAVVMGRIRSALRAYSLLDESPERVLDLVDRKVHHFELGAMVTVACAVLDPPYETMTIALAGHPPPMIAAPQQGAALVDVEPDPPIGTQLPVGNRRSTTIPLAPDSVVAFYTDGLIERHGESLDVGFSRLREAMSLGPPEDVARDIMRHVIGNYVPQDDIALVVMRRTGSPVKATPAAP